MWSGIVPIFVDLCIEKKNFSGNLHNSNYKKTELESDSLEFFMNRAPTVNSDPERRAKWINAIQQIQVFEDINGHICVCNRHFGKKDLTSIKTAVPTIFDSADSSIENCVNEDDAVSQSEDICVALNQCLSEEATLLRSKVKEYEVKLPELCIANQKLLLKEERIKAAYEEEVQKGHRLSKDLDATKVKIQKLEIEIKTLKEGRTIAGEDADIDKVCWKSSSNNIYNKII